MDNSRWMGSSATGFRHEVDAKVEINDDDEYEVDEKLEIYMSVHPGIQYQLRAPHLAADDPHDCGRRHAGG